MSTNRPQQPFNYQPPNSFIPTQAQNSTQGQQWSKSQADSNNHHQAPSREKSSRPTSTSQSEKNPPINKELEQKKRERDRREQDRKEKEHKRLKEAQKNKIDTKKSGAATYNGVNHLKHESDFVCKLQFRNTLPDVPFDPKLLVLPLDNMRYIKYSATFLEQNYKFPLFTEPDLGISVNLIDPEAYRVPVPRPPLERADDAIIDAPMFSAAKGRTRNMREPRPTVSWLRKTEYLTSEESLPRFNKKGIETRPLWKHKDERQDTVDAKIKVIEDGFEVTKRPPTHPTNPSLKPVEVLPVFPDFELWSTRYIEAVYKGDPLTSLEQFKNMGPNTQQEIRTKAILRGCGNNVVAFLTPRHTPKADGSQDYEQIRTFHFELDQNTEHKDDFFFYFTQDTVYYNALETRLKLSKSSGRDERAQARPSSITISRAEMSEETAAERDGRLQQLLQPTINEEGFED